LITAYLGLGSNLGDREATRLTRVSSVYETEPVGIEDQPLFLNAAAEIETELNTRELLAAIREAERRTGRKKTLKWGPRIIDIDILLYGDECVTEENLEIPHPEMHRRAFVLTPLAEIAPLVKHPAQGLTVQQMSAGVGDRGVRSYSGAGE
jgi:2-amino-4-hydroxy-6-hydroxymethyldihydropteridine diphosphokinase